MFSNHPANLILRFVLEIVALVAVGQWAWRAGESFGSALARYAFTIGLPLLFAAVWAVFRAPEDSTQPEGKKPIVAVPGKLRLFIEYVFFGFAVWSAFNTQRVAFGLFLGFALLLHYIWSMDRVVKLWRQR